MQKDIIFITELLKYRLSASCEVVASASKTNDLLPDSRRAGWQLKRQAGVMVSRVTTRDALFTASWSPSWHHRHPARDLLLPIVSWTADEVCPVLSQTAICVSRLYTPGQSP